MSKKPNILFTDDEKTFRNIMTKELTRMGYNVTGCGSGAETIEKMQEKDFDVVILDMNMPVMDGIETMKRVKEMEPTTEVIVLTGQGTIENAVQATKLGAYDYLTKPCKLTELCVLLQKALEKSPVQKLLYYEIGLVYLRLNQLENAQTAMRQFLAAAPAEMKKERAYAEEVLKQNPS